MAVAARLAMGSYGTSVPPSTAAAHACSAKYPTGTSVINYSSNVVSPYPSHTAGAFYGYGNESSDAVVLPYPHYGPGVHAGSYAGVSGTVIWPYPGVPIPTKAYGGGNAHIYHPPAWLPSGQDLEPGCSQEQQNGGGHWGTPDNPDLPLPPYLQGGHNGNGYPWRSNYTANSTNPYTSWPDTGVTRKYDFTISAKTIAPDGVEKPGIVVNGQFPGPLIEANWGDWIEVTVTNLLESDGTSLHWHGFLQVGTPYYDGTAAVQQCPIAPGKTFTYRFQAQLYGTTWYHAHYSAQYSGGALGPIVVHGPKTQPYDIDMGPIILSDWYHTDYEILVNQTMNAGPNPPPFSNNNLIQGKNNYPCANTTAPCTPNAGLSKFKFQSGKKHLLRLINTSAEGIEKFSIDGHQLTIIANDFVPVVPYTTNVVTLGIGQRADVIVEGIGAEGSAYWMRADLGFGPPGIGCSLSDGVSPVALAGVYYEGADTNTVPTTNSTVTSAQILTCANDPLDVTQPLHSQAPPTPEIVKDIDMEFGSNGTHFIWFMNNSSFRGDYNDPPLLEAALGNTTFPTEWNIYNTGNSKSIQLVIYNHWPLGVHPMHMHGHSFYVLSEGFGTWDGSVTQANNPIRRDVQLLPPAQGTPGNVTAPAYLAIQIDLDNPGSWPFHCHIAWHISQGLYINILEQPDKIAEMSIPSDLAQSCQDWSAFTSTTVVDQIDSGP